MYLSKHFQERLEDRFDDWYGDIDHLLKYSVCLFRSYRDCTIRYHIYQGNSNDYVLVMSNKVIITTYKISKRSQVFKLYVKDNISRYKNSSLLNNPDKLFHKILYNYKKAVIKSKLYWNSSNTKNFYKIFQNQLELYLQEMNSI